MKRLLPLILLAAFAAQAAELAIPDASRRPIALGVPAKTPITAPGAAGKALDLPPPPEMPAGLHSTSVMTAAAPTVSNDLDNRVRGILTELKTLTVVAVLGDTAVLRSGSGSTLTVKSAEPQTFYEGITLTATVSGDNVQLLAKAPSSKTAVLAFSGSIQSDRGAVAPGANTPR